MFDTLLSLPLFQGLGRADLTRILESTHLKFETMMPEAQFVRQDELCNDVFFVMDGEMTCTTFSADRSWSVEESIPTPSVLGLEVLYGMTRVYPFSATATTEVRLMRIDKRTIAALTGYFEVFRINVLNTLSTAISRQRQIQWLPATTSLEGRIIDFLRGHVLRPAGRKDFNISLRSLGAYLGEDYRYISKALHNMEQQGLLVLKRRVIHIPAFEELIKHTSTKE